jgi:small-conductance mechanosensitive channel
MTIRDWMQATVAGNSIAAWLTTVAWALGATLTVVLLRRLLANRLAALAARTEMLADDAAIEAVRSIRKSYVLLISLGLAAISWLEPGDWRVWVWRAVVVVAVLQGLRTGNKIVDFWVRNYAMRRAGLDRTTMRALGYAGRVAVWITIVVFGIEAAGFRAQTLLTGLGVGGIAIALAVQNVLGDLFAAMSIVLDKPFVVGDTIAVDAFEGDVVHIGLKSTRVRSVNGEEVVFSNADLLKSRLRNLSRREARRYVITLLLAPGTPAAQVARVPDLVAEAVRADGRATFQRSHVKAVDATGIEVESAIVVPGGAADWLKAMDVRHGVLLGILRVLEREHVQLAQANLVGTRAVPA